MRDYGQVSPTFWTRGSGKKLRGNPIAQLVAIYLCTAPGANAIGLYYLPRVVIAHDTGIPIAQIDAALAAIETAGFAFYDAAVDLVYVPNGAEYQIGDALSAGDRRRPLVLRELKRAGSHRFAGMFREQYGDAYNLAPSDDKSCKPIPQSGMAIPDPKIPPVIVPVIVPASDSLSGSEIATVMPEPAKLREDYDPGLEKLRQALEEGMRRGRGGRPIGLKLSPGDPNDPQRQALLDSIRVHAADEHGRYRGDVLLKWLVDDGAAFAEFVEQMPPKLREERKWHVNAVGFLRWLNDHAQRAEVEAVHERQESPSGVRPIAPRRMTQDAPEALSTSLASFRKVGGPL